MQPYYVLLRKAREYFLQILDKRRVLLYNPIIPIGYKNEQTFTVRKEEKIFVRVYSSAAQLKRSLLAIRRFCGFPGISGSCAGGKIVGEAGGF